MSASTLENKFRKLAAMPASLFRWMLCRYFGFEPWHITPLAERKYARDIIQHLNARSVRNSAIEIGCGLGDLIRNLNYKTRKGYDLDNNVLKGAEFLTKVLGSGKVDYQWFRFPDSPLEGKADAIILVNWIHHVPGDVLKSKIEEYFTNHLTNEGELVIDTVQHNEYKYNHSIKNLTASLDCHIEKIGDDIRNRETFAIQKKSR